MEHGPAVRASFCAAQEDLIFSLFQRKMFCCKEEATVELLKGQGAFLDLMTLYDRHPAEVADLLQNTRLYYRELKGLSLSNVPSFLEIAHFPKSGDFGRLVMIKGTVLRASQNKFKEELPGYTCRECGAYTAFQGKVKKCGDCGSGDVKKEINKSECIDCQEIRIQERSNLYMPQNISVILEGVHVDKCQPGDEVCVSGVVAVRWSRIKVGEVPRSEFVIQCMSIVKDVPEKNPDISILFDKAQNTDFDRRQVFLSHFCSEIYGHRFVKFGLLLALVGGVEKRTFSSSSPPVEATGKNAPSECPEASECHERREGAENPCVASALKTRGNSHVFLMGDPGVGKSQLMRFCARLITPSTITSGIGCTGAGLTACAIKQDKEWSIEAGALVLSDKGVCCIDDFDTLRNDDKASILEAMEQQSISIAKVGVVLKLETRCSVIGACNARNVGDRGLKVLEKTSITLPLASRFDLFFGMRDACKSDRDVAEFILGGKAGKTDISLLREVVRLAKEISPSSMDSSASSIIKTYYGKQRARMPNVTVRALEGHIRLTEAHARLMGRSTCTEEDAIMGAIVLNGSYSMYRFWEFDEERLFLDPHYLRQCFETAKAELSV